MRLRKGKEVVASSFIRLKTVNLASKTENIAEGRMYTNKGSIFERKFVPNAKKTYFRPDKKDFTTFNAFGNDSKARKLGST